LRWRNGKPRVTIDLLDRRIARAIFLSLWALYACIGPGFTVLNANVVPRIGLALSILEHRSLSIDDVAPDTIDKAEIGQHYYLEKAPGISLMALPVVAGVDVTARALGFKPIAFVDGRPTVFYVASVWAAVVFTSALFTAAVAAWLYLLARHLDAAPGAALFGALGYALCTPAFGWATVLFGHSVAGACLFMGFVAIMFASDPAFTARRAAGAAFAAGALLAWSVVVEFPSGPGAVLIAAFGCWRLCGVAVDRRVRLLGGALAAGVAAAVPFALYNALAFGSVLHIGYSEEVGFIRMHSGLFGVSLPRADVAGELLFGTHRGILWLAPLLLVVPVAWVLALRRFGPVMAIPLLGVPCAFFLINAGYVYWDGGASTGPRHLTPMLPFLAFALVPLWEWADGAVRAVLAALAGLSAALSLMCATTIMSVPPMLEHKRINDELFDFVFPAFWSGQVHNAWAPLGAGGIASVGILVLPVIAGILLSGAVPLILRNRRLTGLSGER
jgi:hypothetical protein